MSLLRLSVLGGVVVLAALSLARAAAAQPAEESAPAGGLTTPFTGPHSGVYGKVNPHRWGESGVQRRVPKECIWVVDSKTTLEVAKAQCDADWNYRVAVSPGHYTVTALADCTKEVDIRPGEWVDSTCPPDLSQRGAPNGPNQ